MPSIDLTGFNLTTSEVGSDGNAKTYWPGEFTDNEYFKVLDTGEVDLWAPTKGDATTPNSDRSRTEFREIIPGTKTLKNWQLGEHPAQYLRVAMTMRQTNSNGRVCIGQIHIKDISRPVLKIIADASKDPERKVFSVQAKIRQNCNQSDDPGFVLLESVPLDERISYSVAVSGGGVISINFAHGTRRGECRFNLLPSYVGRLLYFKAGLYVQEDATELTLPTEGARARLHSLVVER
ncbi:polysaccharide lyase family 7 protein [Azotobacter salinestris]|uniref:polysaccharide lyase family 7 protein n=1 Tax=Azotobacter salinestris TaxID=69964 RepID=UPI001266B3E5|nr:polysaccharide lyase family 7 protein [Azotobacter salinestris]